MHRTFGLSAFASYLLVVPESTFKFGCLCCVLYHKWNTRTHSGSLLRVHNLTVCVCIVFLCCVCVTALKPDQVSTEPETNIWQMFTLWSAVPLMDCQRCALIGLACGLDRAYGRSAFDTVCMQRQKLS